METLILVGSSKYYRFVGHKLPSKDKDRVYVKVHALGIEADVHVSTAGPWAP